MTARTDENILSNAQKLLDRYANRLVNLKLTAEAVSRDAGIVRVLVRPSRAVHSEEYVHVLAAVETALDTEDDETVLLVPVIDEEAA